MSTWQKTKLNITLEVILQYLQCSNSEVLLKPHNPYWGITCKYYTIIGWGFCDIQNNQGRGRGYQLKSKTEADNPYQDLHYSGYHKNRIYNCFNIHWTKQKNVFTDGKQNKASKLDMITLRNHAPRSYTTWLPVTLTWLLYTLHS